jgi:hypothetical protein
MDVLISGCDLARRRKCFWACVRICTIVLEGISLAMSCHCFPNFFNPSSNLSHSSSVQRPVFSPAALDFEPAEERRLVCFLLPVPMRIA